MTEQHPITPPPELVHQWANHSASVHRENGTYEQHEFAIATQAARWGADHELEACCEVLYARYDIPNCIAPMMAEDMREWLRAARRPKSPSLNEVALQMLGTIERDAHYLPEITDTIRRALEQLDD